MLWGDAKFTYSEPGYSEEDKADLTSLHIGLLGKYPIDMGNMTVFPALGIDYQIIREIKYMGYSIPDAGDFSSLWIRFGGGVDYDINPQMFIRGTLLYGIKMASKMEKDMEKEIKDMVAGFGSVETLTQHGIQIKLAIGYRF
jgi:hypothetical protein